MAKSNNTLQNLNWNIVLKYLSVPGGGTRLELTDGYFHTQDSEHKFQIEEGVPQFMDSTMDRDVVAHFDETALEFGKDAKAVEVLPSIASALRVELTHLIEQRGQKQVVVDIGCGHGHFSEKLPQNHTVFGVDVSHQMLKLTRGTEIFPLLADGMNLPFETGSLDCAYTIEVVQLFENPAPILKEMARIVKPGGLVIVSTLHRGSVLRRINRALKGIKPDETTILRFPNDIVEITNGLPLSLESTSWVMGPTSLCFRGVNSNWMFSPLASNIITTFVRDT